MDEGDDEFDILKKQLSLKHMHISYFLIILNHSMVHAERTSILHLHNSQTPWGL